MSLPPAVAPAGGERPATRFGIPSFATLLGSLAVVVGLFLLAAWMLRKMMPKSAQPLPREAVEMLGRAPLAGRQQAHLVRVGNKILLVAIGPNSAETLTEITDPVEVDRLAGILLSRPTTKRVGQFSLAAGQFQLRRQIGPAAARTARRTRPLAFGRRRLAIRLTLSPRRERNTPAPPIDVQDHVMNANHEPRRSIRAFRAIALAFVATCGACGVAQAQVGNLPATLPIGGGLAGGPDAWTSPQGLTSALQVLLMLTVLSLAPAVLLMTTCFVRMIIVFGLLKQAIGTQQLPPSQVLTSITLFLTLLIMSPVWKQVYDDGIAPYTSKQISLDEAWTAGVRPVRKFMSMQIDRTGNGADVWLFYKYLPKDTPTPSSYDDVPLAALLPAFMLSELKTAFLIGFQIYIPFVVLDIVIAVVTVSMGLLMLPPSMISLPFKLLLFVLVDGWHLVVGMLLDSFQPFS